MFTYDNNGNICERCEYAYTSKTGEELEELSCNHFNYEYESGRLADYNGETFAYNNLGSPTTYRGKAATWKYGKLLKSYDGNTFGYNCYGQRISKNGTEYAYDNDGNIVYSSDGLEFIYDGTGVTGFTYKFKYYFYRKDAQGNIKAILDRNGAAVVKYEYDAWGNHKVIADEENEELANLNPFRYRGYYYDVETGLYYLKTRYYDPEVGRFLSQDSTEYAEPETINGLNLYAYCGNNPVMRTDSNGTNWWTDFWRGLGGDITKIVIGLAVIAGLGVASLLTGGIAGAILTGAFIGAVTAGISTSIVGAVSGQSFTDFADSFLSGIIVGGFSGAIGGTGIATGFLSTTLGLKSILAISSQSLIQTTLFQVGVNAIIGVSSYLINSARNGESVNFYDFTLSFISGGIGGTLSPGWRGIIMSTALDYISNWLGELFKKLRLKK